MHWIEVKHEQQLNEAINIRYKVFVQEQGVDLELENDEYDSLESACTHILVLKEEKALGTGRIRILDGIGKIERVCVLSEARGQHVGKEIMDALESIATEKRCHAVKLGAQIQVQKFYEQLGYHVSSEPFIDAGIPHVMMQKDI